MNHRIEAFFDPATFTLTYVVFDPESRDAAVIDPVLDFDPVTKLLSRKSLDRLARFVDAFSLRVHWILETHAHADHLSAARELKALWPSARLGVGERLHEVFATFQKAFRWPDGLGLARLGVDRFFRDGEEFAAGTLRLQVVATPGHTPACVTYRIGDSAFTGDVIFMPDSGTGRCDFPGGSASDLYASVWGRIYSWPESTRIFVGHDYQPGGRSLRYMTTVGELKRTNIHLRAGTSLGEFVAFRQSRDKTLAPPRLLEPSLDWNLAAHQLIPRL